MKPDLKQRQPSWAGKGRFHDEDTDPLSGLTNIMDVMLVFALGLMLALIAQHQQLQQTYLSGAENSKEQIEIQKGKSLNDVPKSVGQSLQSGDGMQSLGKVYRDPQTGKLILIEHN